MTRDEARQLLPIIQAYSEGKTVEMRLDREWRDVEDPEFDAPCDCYRIKPEPIECWAVVTPAGFKLGFQARKLAVNYAEAGDRVIRMREV